jgi:hypothetical protein
LTSFHHQVAKSFATVYDERFAKIGREEFIIDEASIAEFTGLPRTGECWFKSTVSSNLEFRSYFLPIHKDLIWKKDIPMSFLEPQWQALLKAIFVYIICEGRYNKGLITLLVKETLKKKQVDWGFFLFWNEFQTEGPPEEEAKKTSGRRTVTPKSNKRERSFV